MRYLRSSNVGGSVTDRTGTCRGFSQCSPAGNQEITMLSARTLIALSALLVLVALALAGCGGGGGGY